MKLCENCAQEHDGTFASGRFCSEGCARSFASKSKREEINKKVSAKLKGRPSNRSHEDFVAAATKRTQEFLRELPNKDFNSLPYETKRIRVLLEQNFCCAFCKRSEWMGRPLILELDHEDGNKKNNSRSNLRMLCPDCHSSTPTWRGRKLSFQSQSIAGLEKQKKIFKSLPESSND